METHGKSKTPTYESWKQMRSRCRGNTPHRKRYYGSVMVCERWNSFENFLADMGERPAGKTLDRWPDPCGNYEPGNCRWATKSEQQNNCRSNHALSVNGVTLNIRQWASLNGVHENTIHTRLKRGWSPERAVQHV